MRRLTLHVERLGPPRGTGVDEPERIVFLHGFTQTGRSWRPIAERFAERYSCEMVDLPGHGGSSDTRLGLKESAMLIGKRCGRATYVGYSLGGRVALHLATYSPELVERLVTVGATGGIDAPDERARRCADDDALATNLELIGLDSFLTEWLQRPLFSNLPSSNDDLADRRRNTVAGLAASLRMCGTGRQTPLWNLLASFDRPALITAGRLDPKFTSLGRRLPRTLPNAAFRSIADAGHAAHIEQPDAFSRLLTSFLSR